MNIVTDGRIKPRVAGVQNKIRKLFRRIDIVGYWRYSCAIPRSHEVRSDVSRPAKRMSTGVQEESAVGSGTGPLIKDGEGVLEVNFIAFMIP
jgi:hypothetical protein